MITIVIIIVIIKMKPVSGWSSDQVPKTGFRSSCPPSLSSTPDYDEDEDHEDGGNDNDYNNILRQLINITFVQPIRWFLLISSNLSRPFMNSAMHLFNWDLVIMIVIIIIIIIIIISMIIVIITIKIIMNSAMYLLNREQDLIMMIVSITITIASWTPSPSPLHHDHTYM